MHLIDAAAHLRERLLREFRVDRHQKRIFRNLELIAPDPVKEITRDRAIAETIAGYKVGLDDAEVYAIDPVVFPMLVKAADELPDGAIVYRHQVRSQVGFVVLPEPILVTTFRQTDGSDWGTSKLVAGMWLTHPDPEVENIIAYGIYHTAGGSDPAGSYTPASMFEFAFGKTWDPGGWKLNKDDVFDDQGNEWTYHLPGPHGLWPMAFILAHMMFCDQTIIVDDHWRPSRAERRRCRKAGRPDPPLVRYITLREKIRRAKEAQEGRGIDWAYRWITSGHWRNQWYPSKQEHNWKWIAPYIKGPKDRPLKPQPERLYHVAR